MIYLFTALYCEAQIFIDAFHLLKNQEATCFQEFYNETASIRLTITGVGEIAAATAIGSVCSTYRPTKEDFLLNIGICAHTTKKDGIFLCNQIIENATSKTFYPDMLYRHNFCEETIVTGMLPWNTPNNAPEKTLQFSAGTLYDMEAAAIYQAGIYFFCPHQMIFLKIVSDNGAIKEISKEQTVLFMEKYQDCILAYIEQIITISQKRTIHKHLLSWEEENLFETFCTDLHCSKTMRDSMRQYIQYLALTGVDYVSIIQEMYRDNLLPCKDKREGKLCFETFKRRLF